jgi:hypothetical protein
VRLCLSKFDERQIVALIGAMQVYAPGSSAPYFDPTYERTSAASHDALQAAGVPGAFFPPPAGAEPKPRPEKRRLAHRHKIPRVADTLDPTTRSPGAVAVPLPAGAGVAPRAAASSNPLLAPLQAAPRAPAASEMPLPATLAPGRAAAAETKPTLAPIPLPN